MSINHFYYYYYIDKLKALDEFFEMCLRNKNGHSFANRVSEGESTLHLLLQFFDLAGQREVCGTKCEI